MQQQRQQHQQQGTQQGSNLTQKDAETRAAARLSALHGLLLLIRYLLADTDWTEAADAANGSTWATTWLADHAQLLRHVASTCLPPLADPHGTGNEAADVDALGDDPEAGAEEDDDDYDVSCGPAPTEQLRSSGK